MAIPRCEYVAFTGGAYPLPFVGSPLILGVRLDGCTDDVRRAASWPQLGAFLTALHRFPVERAFPLGIGGCPTADVWRSAMADLCRRCACRSSSPWKMVSRSP